MSKYFYCYNVSLSKYLNSKGIRYITVAREPKSNKLFSLYEINTNLQNAIDEYRALNNI